MSFDDFHSYAGIQGIPLAALRTYFEAGRLSGCMERLNYFRKRFEDRGLVPWSKELNYPPDNFEQCSVEPEILRGIKVDATARTPEQSQQLGANVGTSDHCSKIIPAQFVQHGQLETHPKNPSKGPLKIKKWMVR